MDEGGSAFHNGINVGGGMYAPFGMVEKPGAELLPPTDNGPVHGHQDPER